METTPITLVRRIPTASNQTFLATAGRQKRRVIYKPIAGESPLWDFPDQSLALREVASYRLSQASGFGVVPFTELTEGPFGIGSIQRWVDSEDDELVDIIEPSQLHDDQIPILAGQDEHSQPVLLVHRDDTRLRRLALFDVVTNNADRKGAHILISGGTLYGIDNGLSFHPDPKLRTILWGWAEQPLTSDERQLVQNVVGVAADALDILGSQQDVTATLDRAQYLLATNRFPTPSGTGPAIPWPPL